jgi:predicted dehydrogenase
VLNVLILGCGNIGALYDFNLPNKTLTHIKALTGIRDSQITVFDVDLSKSRMVSEAYKCNLVEDVAAIDWGRYDLVSITTPTSTHSDLLARAMKANVKSIICEKPVTDSLADISAIREDYSNSASKVTVNYIRRFQPAYIDLRREIKEIESRSSFSAAVVKYNRGFLNNGSHAIDLLQFLFDRHFSDISFVSSLSYDAFISDPTISTVCNFGNRMVHFIGVPGISYPLFEMDILYSEHRIQISDRGNRIEIWRLDDKGHWGEIYFQRNNVLDHYMIPVVEKALEVATGAEADNFENSLLMNETILKVIQSLKN